MSSTCYLMDLLSWVSDNQSDESRALTCANLCADCSNTPSLSYCTQIQPMSKAVTTARILVFILHSLFYLSSVFWETAQEVQVHQELKHVCGKPGVQAQARTEFCGMWCSLLCVLIALQLKTSVYDFPALDTSLIPCLPFPPHWVKVFTSNKPG